MFKKSMFSTLIRSATNVVDQINNLLARAIAWLTLIMVLVTCIIVVARYVLNLGSIGLQESVMYMHGAVFMLGIAYTFKEGGHVRVDVIYEKLSHRQRVLIDLFGHCVFLLPVAGFILISSLDYVQFSWSLTESSGQPGGLPGVYLLKTLIPIMALLLIAQGIAEIIRGLSYLTQQNHD